MGYFLVLQKEAVLSWKDKNSPKFTEREREEYRQCVCVCVVREASSSSSIRLVSRRSLALSSLCVCVLFIDIFYRFCPLLSESFFPCTAVAAGISWLLLQAGERKQRGEEQQARHLGRGQETKTQQPPGLFLPTPLCVAGM